MDVLVTGANGFVGGALLLRLAELEGWQPIAAVRTLPSTEPILSNSACIGKAVRYVELGDVENGAFDPCVFNGVDAVVHCAARVHVMNESDVDPLSAFRAVNVVGTLNLAKQAASVGVKRFVFISTIKVNGEATVSGEPFHADDLPAPEDAYGLSKLEAEQGLKLLAAEGLVQIDAGRGSRVTRLTLEDLNQLFPVMAMLEGRCAHEAVKHIDDAGVQQLEALHAAMEAAAAEGNIAEYYRNNYLIHETVQHYAGNPWLIRITHDLHRILKMHRGRQLLTPGRTAQSLAEHRELMECFRRRDAQAAERTMERHLLSQGQALAAYVAAGGLLNVPAPLPTEGGG
ncbi:MAG TPA: hypothetical protein DDY11_04275 [Leclercia adecarboxylata]|nr:hypothetical protein [Leclercia adecarboxylata]